MQEAAEYNMKSTHQHFTSQFYCHGHEAQQTLFSKFTFLRLSFHFDFLPLLLLLLYLPSLLQCIPCGRDPSRYQEVIASLPSTLSCGRAYSTRSWSLWSQSMTRRPASKSGITVTPFWWNMMTQQTSPVSILDVFKSSQSLEILKIHFSHASSSLNRFRFKGSLSKGNASFDHKRINSFFTPSSLKSLLFRGKIHRSLQHLKLLCGSADSHVTCVSVLPSPATI